MKENSSYLSGINYEELARYELSGSLIMAAIHSALSVALKRSRTLQAEGVLSVTQKDFEG